MSHTPKALVLLAAAAVFTPSIAFAELESELSAYVVTTDGDGYEVFSPANAVKPGQVIEYRIKHTNTFNEAVSGVAVVGPIPSEAILALGDSTSTAEAVFEIRAELDPDQPGEEWSSLPAMRVVILDDGTRTLEEAKPEHFTAVRWTIATPLASEQTVANTYRVEVR